MEKPCFDKQGSKKSAETESSGSGDGIGKAECDLDRDWQARWKNPERESWENGGRKNGPIVNLEKPCKQGNAGEVMRCPKSSGIVKSLGFCVAALGIVDGTKTNSVDLVTQHDVQVEELVQREIASAYPDFTLCVVSIKSKAADGRVIPRHSIGEESFSAGKTPSLTDEPRTLCVDPIGERPRAELSSQSDRDAQTERPTLSTASPLRASPSASSTTPRRPVLGVVYNPFLDHLVRVVNGISLSMPLCSTTKICSTLASADKGPTSRVALLNLSNCPCALRDRCRRSRKH